MILEIRRFKEIEDGTLGKLTLVSMKDHKVLFNCWTLEPAGPDTTDWGKDRRIPKGSYQVEWFNSPKYKQKLPCLFNKEVPAERRILIHSGNLPDHTLGCILVGMDYNNQGVWNSKKALKELFKFIINKNFKTFIINDIKVNNE